MSEKIEIKHGGAIIESSIQCMATASLKEEIEQELSSQDESLAELIEEQKGEAIEKTQ